MGELAFQVEREPELIPSYSNDAWVLDLADLGPSILRVCWRGNRERLITECVLGPRLPPEVGYPELLRHGRLASADLTWMLTRRLPGCTLAEAWVGLNEPDRGAACRSTASMMRSLHRWRPGPKVVQALRAHRRLDGDARAIVGSTINPLPMPRLRRVAVLAGTVRGVNRGLVRDVVDWLDAHRELLPPLDDPEGAVLHADLHMGNIWWDGEAVTGLIDFEFARLGPPWVELARITDSVASNQAEGVEGCHQLLLDSLGKHYPEVLAFPRLSERIMACRLAFELRQLVIREPLGPAVSSDHPLAVLNDLLGRG